MRYAYVETTKAVAAGIKKVGHRFSPSGKYMMVNEVELKKCGTGTQDAEESMKALGGRGMLTRLKAKERLGVWKRNKTLKNTADE